MTPWRPKIRWYDYPAAILAADFLWGNIQIALFAQTWWASLLGGIAAYLIWDLWESWYCKKFRIMQEFRKWYDENH